MNVIDNLRPQIGQIWRYKDTEARRYRVIWLPEIKIDGEWVHGVGYMAVGSMAKSYARTEVDFMDKFEYIIGDSNEKE